MTQEEIEKRTDEKVKQIKALCVELKISISAEQAMMKNGLIKNLIYYTDMEDYPKKLEVISQK